MVEKAQYSRPIFGKEVRGVLRVEFADGSDHGDALETVLPISLDVGIEFISNELVQLGRSLEIVKFDQGSVDLEVGCLHY